MRLLFRHPDAPANVDHNPKATWRQHEELMLLMILAPIVVSLPSVSFALIWQWLLKSLLMSVVVLVSFLTYVVFSWPKTQTVQPMRALAFQPDLIPKKLDTIVIGSGSGGSTCCSLLAQSGQRVLVLEQHPTVTGGCTHSFRERNCEWDTGLHYSSKAMGDPLSRSGSIMDFASHGMQEWTPLQGTSD